MNIREEGLREEKSLKGQENLLLRRVWELEGGERLWLFLETAGLTLGIAFLFYRSLLGAVPVIPLSIIFYKNGKRRLEERKRDILLKEIADAIMAVSVAMKAGAALENAVTAGREELDRLWGNKSLLRAAWLVMEKRIALREPVARSFENMAADLGISELSELSELLVISKRSGGSLAGLIDMYGLLMSEKLSVKQDIMASLTEKRMEKNIMLLMPPGIIAYLCISSYDWIRMLYESIEGRLFMSACLGIYILAFVLGEKYLKIMV